KADRMAAGRRARRRRASGMVRACEERDAIMRAGNGGPRAAAGPVAAPPTRRCRTPSLFAVAPIPRRAPPAALPGGLSALPRPLQVLHHPHWVVAEERGVPVLQRLLPLGRAVDDAGEHQ